MNVAFDPTARRHAARVGWINRRRERIRAALSEIGLVESLTLEDQSFLTTQVPVSAVRSEQELQALSQRLDLMEGWLRVGTTPLRCQALIRAVRSQPTETVDRLLDAEQRRLVFETDVDEFTHPTILARLSEACQLVLMA